MRRAKSRKSRRTSLREDSFIELPPSFRDAQNNPGGNSVRAQRSHPDARQQIRGKGIIRHDRQRRLENQLIHR